MKQFWIYSPKADIVLEHFSKKHINWKRDDHNLLQKLFFPYELRYGYYVLIKPDGNYNYYLSEYSKKMVLDDVKQFF